MISPVKIPSSDAIGPQRDKKAQGHRDGDHAGIGPRIPDQRLERACRLHKSCGWRAEAPDQHDERGDQCDQQDIVLGVTFLQPAIAAPKSKWAVASAIVANHTTSKAARKWRSICAIPTLSFSAIARSCAAAPRSGRELCTREAGRIRIWPTANSAIGPGPEMNVNQIGVGVDGKLGENDAEQRPSE